MRQLCLVLAISLTSSTLVTACGGDDEALRDAGGATPDAEVTTPDADTTPQPSVARGEYLVEHVAACGDCHTPRLKTGAPDLDNYLAGVECFIDVNGPDAGGCLHSRNLTDHATGLANRSDDEIKTMFQDGIRPNGEALVSVMPYWIFHNLSDVDADSIVMYLRTVPGVDHTVPASDPPWTPPLVAAPAFDLDDMPAPATTSDEKELGRYLATLACVDCHTARTDMNDFRSLDMTRLLAGGNGFPREMLGLGDPFPAVIFTSNLTPHATGLDGWTAAEIIAVLHDGVDPEGDLVCPPMPGGQMAPFGGLTDDDAEAIAAYLMDIAGIDNAIPNGCAIPSP